MFQVIDNKLFEVTELLGNKAHSGMALPSNGVGHTTNDESIFQQLNSCLMQNFMRGAFFPTTRHESQDAAYA